MVAIIAILMALLLPSLKAARDQAKAVKCAANMRAIAQAAVMFSEERDGRGPGGGYRRYMGSTPTGAGTNWVEVLNAEYFKVPSFWPTPKGSRFTYIQQDGGNYGYMVSWALNCPVALDQNPGFTYQTSFYYNGDAAGGPVGVTSLECGPYGVEQDPATVNALYQASGAGWTLGPNTNPPNPYGFADPARTTGYWWGAKLAKFNGAYQILLAEAANGTSGGVRAVGTLVRDTNNFTYNNGVISFRHPFGKNANFAFFDTHVERMGVRDSWNNTARLVMP